MLKNFGKNCFKRIMNKILRLLIFKKHQILIQPTINEIARVLLIIWSAQLSFMKLKVKNDRITETLQRHVGVPKIYDSNMILARWLRSNVRVDRSNPSSSTKH